MRESSERAMPSCWQPGICTSVETRHGAPLGCGQAGYGRLGVNDGADRLTPVRVGAGEGGQGQEDVGRLEGKKPDEGRGCAHMDMAEDLVRHVL